MKDINGFGAVLLIILVLAVSGLTFGITMIIKSSGKTPSHVERCGPEAIPYYYSTETVCIPVTKRLRGMYNK